MNRFTKLWLSALILLMGSYAAQATTITITGLAPGTTLCAGASGTLSYTVTSPSSYGGAETFTAQLSDASGSFTSPTNIGTHSDNNDGDISVTIPSIITTSALYKIRIVTTALDTSGNLAVTLNAVPTVTLTPSVAGNRCVGSTVTYTTEGGGSAYVWLISGTLNTDYTLVSGGTATDNTAEVTWLTSGPKSVSVNYSNGTCTPPAPTVLNFTIGAVPTASFIAPPAGGVCTNTPTTYTTQGGAGFSNFGWTNTGTLGVDYTLNSGGDATSNTASITWLNPGSYTLTVNYIDANNCTSAAPASTTTTVNGRPAVSFTTEPGAEVCINQPITYTTQTGGGISAYDWNFPGSTLNTHYTLQAGTGTLLSNTAVVTWLTTGSKTVTVNYLNIGLCPSLTSASNTTTVTATVGTPVFAPASNPVLRCQGGNNVTYVATAAGSTAITYSLDVTSTGAGNTINATTGEVTYISTWSGTSTITASAAGCNGPSTAPLVVTTTPTVGNPVFNPAVVTRCQGAATVTYGATVTDGTIAYSLDLASLAGGNTINSTTGAVTYASGWKGNTTITATATGCNGPKTAALVIATVGFPQFSSPTSTRCQAFESIAYPASAVNGGTITFALNGGAGSVISGNIVTWDPAFNGTATIVATTNACGSPLSTIHTVDVAAAVGTTSFTLAPLTPCQGSTVDYDAQANDATSIVYSIVTTPSGNATISPSTGIVTFNPSFVGTAVVTATANGCGSSTFASQNIVITPLVTQPVFNVGPSNSICQAPGIITYTATASNTVGPMVYSRSPAAAGTINTATGQMSYNPSFTGLATITATATGCNGTSNSSFIVDVKPTVGVPVFDSGSATVRKQGAATMLYQATAANSTGISYALSPASAGNISAAGMVTLNAAFSGTATITATAFGCNVTPISTHTLTVVQTPVFATTSSSRCQQASSVAYPALSSNGTVTYYVVTNPASPTTTINNSNGTVSFAGDFSGNATIKAVSKLGTVVTDTALHLVTINVAPRLSATTLSHVLCSGDTTAIQLVPSTGTGSTFSYVLREGALISGKSAGTTSLIRQPLINSSSQFPDSFYYEVTVTSPAPASCPSVIKDSVKVRVNPKPVLTAIAPVTICSESSINISLGASTPSTFLWSVSAPSKIDGELPGGGNVINQKLDNTDVSASPTAATATYSIIPTSLFGCAGNPGTALVTVNPLPVVSFASGPSKTICSDDQTGISLSANIASSFAWLPITLTSLNLITGQNAGSGTTINYTLVNSSNSVADSIGYSVTPTATVGSPTCIGKPQLVVVKVNPKPAMTTPATDVVCSQTQTNTLLSATIPSTFTWTIGTVTGGITGQSASSGAVTSINQTLVNPSFATSGTVDYVITPASNTLPSCFGARDTITVTVNPQPKLNSDPARTICSDSILVYLPTSTVLAGTTIFKYTRESLAPSIKNLSQRSTTLIRDTLTTDFILTPATADYNFLLESAAGCKLGEQHLIVTVNPTPDTTGLVIFPQTRLCSGATSMNFSTRRLPDNREYFKWSTTNAGIPIQKVDSSFSQNSLIGFPSAGTATVNIVANARGFNCPSKTTSKSFAIGSAGGNQGINVVLFSNNLVAQVTGAKAYQWGFDRKLDLDSTIISGETAQSYDTRKGFNTGANLYWVMVTFTDDCVQKAYFNAPALGITPTASRNEVELKMYPNPVQDVLNLEITGTQGRDLVYELYDLAGKSLYQAPGGTKTRIPVSDLAPGYYVVTCTEAGVRVATSRFIKN
jgi:hypothetical protein